MAKSRQSNLKRAREEADAAEALDSDEAKPAKKAKAKRKSKKKVAVEARMKLYWGVFSQSLKRVAVFEFDQKDEAEKRAKDLSKSGKSPHFVQKVKEEIVIE